MSLCSSSPVATWLLLVSSPVNFGQILYDAKKISQPICIRNVWYLCSEILLNVLHNMSFVTIVSSWGPRPPQFLSTFGIPFSYLQIVPHIQYMIQQAYKYVSSSFWPCLTIFKLKITNIYKSSRWGLEQGELPWEHNFLWLRCVSVELSAYQVSMVCAANKLW